MDKNHGVAIAQVRTGSMAQSAGIISGDTIVSVNNHRVNDSIDFMFYNNEDSLELGIQRRNRRLSFRFPVKTAQDLGIELKASRVKTCTNKCVFCFVNQLPKGLRKTLYIKDEDYRLSFLYGSYITLTNLTNNEKKRIIEQRLSPIYISVHTTNPVLRSFMLSNPKAADVLKEIRFFKENKIRMHCQIVLCPGLNDGNELQRTIRDLYKFYPFVSSIAVVPVGLTAHRNSSAQIRPVEKNDAARVLELINSFQKRFSKKHGDNIVYGADELYIKAETEFPPVAAYGDLPQLENGVGLVPSFTQQAKRLKIPQPENKNSFITFSGTSFYPYLSKFIDRLRKSGIDINAVPVENTFFGKTVTVAGLLTGRDTIKTLSGVAKKDATLLIPDIVMRDGDNVFLDDVSKQDVAHVLGINAVVIASTPGGLIKAVTSGVTAAVSEH